MIKRLQSPEELVPLFRVDHGEDSELPCDLVEWVQFLVSVVTKRIDDDTTKTKLNERVAIFADINEGEIDAYIVVADNVNPPMMCSVMILYVWTRKSFLENVELLKTAEEWGVSRGAVISVGRTNMEEKLCNYYGYRTVSRLVEKSII